MSDAGEMLCFHCGNALSDPPRLEQLEDGRDCTHCRDRMLASQPPIFHAATEPQRAERPRATGPRPLEDDGPAAG